MGKGSAQAEHAAQIVDMSGKRPRGTPKTLHRWLMSRPARKEGKYVLQTDGLHDNYLLQTWESAERDRDDFVEEVLDLAQEDANQREAMTQYRLCYILDEQTQGSFLIRKRPARGSLMEQSEPSTLEGVLKQTTRHNEVMMSTMVAAFSKAFDMMAKNNELLAKRVESLETARMEAIELDTAARQALAEVESKDMEQALELARAERWDKLFAIIQAQVAKNGSPEAAMAAEALKPVKPKLPPSE